MTLAALRFWLGHLWLLRNRAGQRGRGRPRRHNPLSSPADWILEERCLPSTTPFTLLPPLFQPDPLMPKPSQSDVNNVLFISNNNNSNPNVKPGVPTPPDKLFTIYNNTNNTIYPFLYGDNT